MMFSVIDSKENIVGKEKNLFAGIFSLFYSFGFKSFPDIVLKSCDCEAKG